MQKKTLFLVIATFTIAQFVILMVFGYTPHPDSIDYLRYAKDAISHGEFYPTKESLYTLPFLWNVGAINAVALSLKIFGSEVPLMLIYSLLKGFSLLLVYLLAKSWFNDKIACIATILYLLYPANYGEGTSMLSEVPFTFFVLAGLLACQRRQFILGGILMGCADYMRPVAIIFIAAYILSNIKNYRDYIKICISYVIFISCIGFYNYTTRGEFFYKAKTGWMCMAQYHWREGEDQSGLLAAEKVTENDNLTYTEKDKVWRYMFFDWLKDHKADYFKQIPMKIIRTYVSDNVNLCAFLPESEKCKDYMYESLSMSSLKDDFPHYTSVQWLTIYNLLFYYTMMILFLCSIKKIRELSLHWGIFIIGTAFIALLGHGEARFHQPFMPFIIIAEAYMVDFLLRKYVRREVTMTTTNQNLTSTEGLKG